LLSAPVHNLPALILQNVFEMVCVGVWQHVWVGGCVQRKTLIGMTWNLTQ